MIRPMQNTTLTALAWGIIAIFLAVDLVWLQASGLVFASSTGPYLAMTGAVCAVLGVVPPAIRYRLRADNSLPARFIAEVATRTLLLVYTAAFLVAIGIGGVIFSYLSTSLALPFRDAELAAFDRTLGFDWPAFLAWTDRHWILAKTLTAAYHTTANQLVLLFIFLSFTRSVERLQEFLAILALCSLATGIGMTLLPAEGAYAYYAPVVQNYASNAGMWHHETVTALRTNAAPVLDFAKMQGLVTFPSFHTVLAIITTYAVRDWRWLLIPVTALNVVVVIATITEGGHHLVDILAGALIACSAIAFVRWLGSAYECGKTVADTLSPPSLA